MKKLGLLIAVLVLVASSAWGFGGPGSGMQGGPGYGMNPNFASNMNLTDAQRAELQSRHDAFMAEMNPLRDELFSKKMELRELWTKINPGQAEISAKQQEIREIQNQMQERATAYQLECRQMLTPEQREKMTVKQASFGGRGGGQGCRMGRW
jgi:Spy/CpxP family protein refolding chaperone